MQPTDPNQWNVLAEILSTTPDVCTRLLRLHRPAECGKCRACTIAGTGLPGASWPCTMHNLATAAVALRQLRERSP